MKFSLEQKQFIELHKEPNKVAIIGENSALTWQEFKQKVDNLIVFLKQNKCNQLASPILVYGHKSENMLVCFYACTMLEIAYIPVDLVYPTERIEKIIKTAEVELILNTTNTELPIENVSQIKIAHNYTITNKQEYYSTKKENKDPVVYIIFTSGSTGEPKGVQISTEALLSFQKWMTGDDFNFTNETIFINTALLSFDLSVFEVMTFASLGATVLLNSKEQTSNPQVLIDRIDKYNGSVWVSTPSFALSFARIENEPKMDKIEAFLFCGEILPHALATQLKSNFKNARVLNTYGPTEATVATTFLEITADILSKYNPLPVGKPKDDCELIIENKEIIIVGKNVSVGYIKNEKLNQEKFIAIENQRAFKTGDNGYLEDDLLFFFGRNDDLVKLHGYRIELNEITSALQSLLYIEQAETIALKRNDVVKKIVSLIVLKSNYEANTKQISEDLSKTLPDYMLPSGIKLVAKIPLNQNGKTDKKLLQEMYLKK